MRYTDDGEPSGRGPGAKSSKGPHAEADRCMRYAYEKLKEVEFLEGLEFQIYDYDTMTGIVREPIYIAFYWKDRGNRYGTTISFHEGYSRFVQALDNLIGKFVSKGRAKWKNSNSMNLYR